MRSSSGWCRTVVPSGTHPRPPARKEGPMPTQGRTGRLRRLGVATALAIGLVGGGAGIAAAASSPSPSPSTTPSSPNGGSGSTPRAGHGRPHGGSTSGSSDTASFAYSMAERSRAPVLIRRLRECLVGRTLAPVDDGYEGARVALQRDDRHSAGGDRARPGQRHPAHPQRAATDRRRGSMRGRIHTDPPPHRLVSRLGGRRRTRAECRHRRARPRRP